MPPSVLLIQPALNEASVISLGLLSITTYLRREGHDAKIVVLSSEDDVKRKVREYAPDVVGISYHWFIHSNVLQIAKKIKAESPDTRVLLGGFSASHFDKQILEYDEERYIDAIIRGDGEKPFLDYVSTLDPRKVENLTYRYNGRIIKKPVTYAQRDLSGLSCTAPDMNDIVDNWGKYIMHPIVKADIYRVGVPRSIGVHPPEKTSRNFDVCLGKGCAYNCVYCGGCRDVHKWSSGRECPLLRPLNEVVSDIHNLEANGVEKICIDFGPFGDESYYRKLFDRLGKTGLDVMFSPFCLPSRELVSALANTFKSCTLEISPETGSERLRKMHWEMGYAKPFYMNEKILRLLEFINDEKKNVTPLVGFIVGLPFETEDDITKTESLIEKIVRSYKNRFFQPQTQILYLPLFLEPGSPIDREPKKFGMKIWRASFEDYVQHVDSTIRGDAPHPLGVEKQGMSEKEVLQRAVSFYKRLNNMAV